MTMIIYCSITNQSIGELFMAGVIPGLIIAIATAFVTYIYAKKLGIKGELRATGAEICKATKEAILALIMPIIIIGVLFITMGVGKAKMKDTLPYLPAYLAAVVVCLLLLIFIPQVSTFLPNLLF